MSFARRWTDLLARPGLARLVLSRLGLSRLGLARLGLGRPGLDVYVFGKHPAWPDFIDVARLPPVPESLRHFHDHLRSGVDAVYTGPSAVPRFLLWHNRGRSGVIGVHPSRDGGNPRAGQPRTGHFRRSPLLIGVAARVPLPVLLNFAGDRIASLAARLSEPSMGEDQVITAITDAVASWRTDFTTASIPPADAVRPPPRDSLPASESHGDLLARTRDAVTHFVTDRSPVVLTVAAAPAGLFVARLEWERLDADTLRAALEGDTGS